MPRSVSEALDRLCKLAGHRARRRRPPRRHRDPRPRPAAPWPSAPGRRGAPSSTISALGRGQHGRGPPLRLAGGRVLERADPGQIVVLLVLADGAEALVLRTTAAVALAASVGACRWTSGRRRCARLRTGATSPGGALLPVEPPRRPEPARMSSTAAGRSVHWKFGFEGSRSADGTVHLPPGPTTRSTSPWPRPAAR